MKNVCLHTTVKPRPPGRYSVYISTLIKVSNRRVGFPSPVVKRFQHVVSCVEISLKPKSSSEGLTQFLGYLAQPFPSGVEMLLGHSPWQLGRLSDPRLTSHLPSTDLRLYAKGVFLQVPAPYFCSQLWIPSQKEKERKDNDLFRRKACLGNNVQSNPGASHCVWRRGAEGGGAHWERQEGP